MRSGPVTLRAALFVAASCLPAAAQYSFTWKALFSPQPQAGWAFGQALTTADMNGDGFCDLVAAERGATVNGVLGTGRAWIFYGPDLESFIEISSLQPVPFEFMGDQGCSAGDVDGDGSGDVLLGARWYAGTYESQGRAHLFLGPTYVQHVILDDPVPEADGAFSFQGVKLADFNGDGLDDIFVGGPQHSARALDGTLLEMAGEAFVWDAKAAVKAGGPGAPSKIANLHPKSNGLFGQLPYVADVDANQLVDLFLGNFGFGAYPGCNPPYSGLVQVIDGPTLSEVAAFCPPPIIGLGHYGVVTYYGDIDRDGQPEIVAPFGSYDGLCPGSGTVLILGGEDFQTIEQQVFSPEVCQGSSGFGGACHVSDVDQDGALDIVALDGAASGGRINVLYGPGYTVVQSFGPEHPIGVTNGWGLQLTSGDFDGDGFAELAWHAPQGNGIGSIYIYDLQTLVSRTTSISVPSGGDVTLDLYCGIGQAGHAYIGLLGISGTAPGIIPQKGVFLPLNVDSVTLAGLTLVGSSVLEGFVGTLDPTGRASMTLHLSPGFPSPLIGQVLSVAALTVEPNGRLGMATTAVSLQLTP